jgi:hypothetical protein
MRITARDNRSGGGGVATDDAAITVHAASGPFVVTAPNTAVTWLGGSNQNVTWNVAGTAGAPVSAASVRILLSTDNGQTFPTVLAASTPNDGAQSITVPSISTTDARVKVEALGNIFFDISNVKFNITPAGGQPNLKIKTLATVPGGGYVVSGAAANIKDITQNAGTGASAISHTKFYWSLNKTFDGGDTLLTPTGGREVPVLAAGATSQVTTAVGIPPGGTGTYYLIAVADANNTNAETIESDNTKAAKIYIGPDLLATKLLLATTTIPPGGAVTVTLDTTNKGKVAAGASIARLYYSADNKLNTSTDTQLDSISIGALNPGQKSTAVRTVNIPGGAASGTRYIFAKVDVTNQVTEAVESNNEKKVAITVP